MSPSQVKTPSSSAKGKPPRLSDARSPTGPGMGRLVVEQCSNNSALHQLNSTVGSAIAERRQFLTPHLLTNVENLQCPLGKTSIGGSLLKPESVPRSPVTLRVKWHSKKSQMIGHRSPSG